MKLFKVILNDNYAIAAEEMDASCKVSMKIDHEGGKSQLRWLIIFASDTTDAMRVGNKIAQNMGLQKIAA